MEQRIPSQDLTSIIENELDFDFKVSEKFIPDMEEFEIHLMRPFITGNKKVFYRGERINDPNRPLLPTVLRKRSDLFKNNEPIVNITADYLLEYYNKTGIPGLYRNTFGEVRKYKLYEFMSFSQHYYDFSPLIDFTKSLYVALSFALKGRDSFAEDCVIYAAEISNPDNYTKDIITAECWVNDLNITVVNSPEEILKSPIHGFRTMKEIRQSVESASRNASPTAKLIDIPTNDLMKYQQGVFLLLDDYSLIYKSYLTKNIRDDFIVTKYVISKDICSALKEKLQKDAPWYTYDCLLDIKKGIRKM